jgi:acetyl-CoA carboxylase biotin carboxylase subunit
VRVDSHIYQDYVIPPYYDSLLAKLIIWAKDREQAINRAQRALEEFIIEGVPTTIPFHLKVLQDKRFLTGKFDTHFIDNLKI